MIRTAVVLLLLGFLASGPTLASDHELRGKASWVRASLGGRYLAMRIPKGSHVRICGALGCVNRTVNDYGPSRRIHPDRIADLSRHDFAAICGHPETLGVCPVVVTLRNEPELTLPPTDLAAPYPFRREHR